MTERSSGCYHWFGPDVSSYTWIEASSSAVLIISSPVNPMHRRPGKCSEHSLMRPPRDRKLNNFSLSRPPGILYFFVYFCYPLRLLCWPLHLKLLDPNQASSRCLIAGHSWPTATTKSLGPTHQQPDGNSLINPKRSACFMRCLV